MLTGEGEAGRWAREIVELLHGRLLEIPNESRPLYHAAAVLICNDLVVLLEAGLRLLLQVHSQKGLRALRGGIDWEGDLEAMRRD